MPESVLEAIKQGDWEFEPEHVDSTRYDASDSMPGTRGKLNALAERIQQGLPLWHPEDRSEHDDESFLVS